MDAKESRAALIAFSTPLFARKGLHGVTVRELARTAGVNVSMISYHFGGKAGLYEAVLREVFAGMLQVAQRADSEVAPAEKFREYVYQCGICFHRGDGESFVPRTASADPAVPECPRCLNNDRESFTEQKRQVGQPTSTTELP